MKQVQPKCVTVLQWWQLRAAGCSIVTEWYTSAAIDGTRTWRCVALSPPTVTAVPAGSMAGCGCDLKSVRPTGKVRHTHGRLMATSPTNDAPPLRQTGLQPLAPVRRIWKRLLLRAGYARAPTFLQILSSELLITEICLHLADLRTRYLLATLCRRPTIQAHAICSMRAAAGLKESDNFAMLRFCQKHLPADKFSGLYSSRLIDHSAYRKDTMRYLQKWKKSGLPLKYTESALDFAIKYGRIDVVKWWIASGLDVKYSEWGMDAATIEGDIEMLQFMKDCGLPLKYSADGIDKACLKERIKSLNWWKASGLELKYSHRALDNACRTMFGEDILNWWRDNNLEFLYSENAFRAASLRCDVEMLQWWKDSGLELWCDVTVLMDAGFAKVLDWWKDRSGTDFVEQVLRDEGWKQFMREDAREKKRMDVVEWWDKH